MKVSLNWIKKYVDIPDSITPKQIAYDLSLRTVEVESVEYVNDDIVLEIDNKSLTNRPDLWGHYGIAREIAAIYENRLTVKVPTGMEERDLSRPVIEVVDFETGELVNEIYTYGDQTIVMDIGMVQASKAKKNSDKTPVQKIAEAEILRRLKRVVPKANLEVSLASDKRVNVYVEDKYKARIIGKQGKRINELEKEIGISINVDSLENSPNSFQKRLEKQAKKNKKSRI